MTEWCLVSEYLSLIVTVIIGVFYFDLEQPSSKRRTHFLILQLLLLLGRVITFLSR